MLDGQHPAPGEVERTAYLDGAAAPPAEITSYRATGAPERTAYLEGGGLPPAMPAHGFAARPEATDTENRPRASTIPDRLRPHGMHAEDELSMTRFPVRQRGMGGMVAVFIGGAVLALGGAGITGWLLTRPDEDESASVAKVTKHASDDAPAAAAAADPPVPGEAAPDLVIGEGEADPRSAAPAEPEAAPPAVAEHEPDPAEPEAPTETPAAEAEPSANAAAPPAEKTDSRTRGSRPRNRRGSSAASTPEPEPTPAGPPVVVHFRKDGVDQAWVKIAGRSVAIESGTSRKIPSGNQRMYKKLAESAGFAACGRFDFKPGQEWVVYVSAGSCRVQRLGG
jgi:hypothetical protein